MKKSLIIASLAGLCIAAPAYADDTTTTTVQHTSPDTYSKTVTQETATSPVDTTVTKEQTTTSTVVPAKPYTASKTSSVTQTDALGNQRKVVKKESVNGDGYMSKEEYHEEKTTN